jgi:hypothetical protein
VSAFLGLTTATGEAEGLAGPAIDEGRVGIITRVLNLVIGVLMTFNAFGNELIIGGLWMATTGRWSLLLGNKADDEDRLVGA